MGSGWLAYAIAHVVAYGTDVALAAFVVSPNLHAVLVIIHG